MPFESIYNAGKYSKMDGSGTLKSGKPKPFQAKDDKSAPHPTPKYVG